MRKFLAIVCTALITISIAAPANADHRDRGNNGAVVLGGILAIAGIAILADGLDDDRNERRVIRHYDRYDRHHYDRPYVIRHYDHYERRHERPQYQRITCQGTDHWRSRSRCPQGHSYTRRID